MVLPQAEIEAGTRASQKEEVSTSGRVEDSGPVELAMRVISSKVGHGLIAETCLRMLYGRDIGACGIGI